MKKHTLKKIARRLRARPQNKTPLCHILINLRTKLFWSAYSFNKELKPILNDSGLLWEYGKRNAIISKYKDSCFLVDHRKSRLGHRTYERNGKFYSYPEDDGLPF